MTMMMSMTCAATLGNVAGPASDGVLVGVLTPTAASKVLLQDGTTFIDDTDDFNDAGAGDVAALPAVPAVGDGLYIGYSQPFCKIKLTVGTARTGTATVSWKYWDGASWVALPTIDDDSAGFSAGTSDYLVHFFPPTDWQRNTAANGPNGQAGYFVKAELTAITSYTQQPLITQGWVYPLNRGAMGLSSPISGRATRVTMHCGTKSGVAADSTFALINVDNMERALIAWPAGAAMHNQAISLPVAVGDKIALVQIPEDGSTEFANASFEIAM